MLFTRSPTQRLNVPVSQFTSEVHVSTSDLNTTPVTFFNSTKTMLEDLAYVCRQILAFFEVQKDGARLPCMCRQTSP
jgi:hypothetical protein